MGGCGKIATLSQSATQSRRGLLWSFAYTNFLRAANFGKGYLIIAIVLSVAISILLTSVSHVSATGTNAVAPILSELPVLYLPIFTVIGSYGSLMIFVSDKDKGVYEYLIAYGVNPSKIFWSIVEASIGLVSIVLAIDISINLGISFASGNVSLINLELLIFYVIPISYAVAIFMSMVGMIWSSLAVRRTGINSPVGVITIIGIAPMLLVFLVALVMRPTDIILFVGAVSLALFVAVGVMIRVSSTKLVRERFLSNA
jgi:hypothetical protein